MLAHYVMRCDRICKIVILLHSILQISLGNSTDTFESAAITIGVPPMLQPPSFDQDLYNFTVPEDADDAYLIGRLSVTLGTCRFK